MKKISKVILSSSLLLGSLDALEFGSMGNISASMGGAGVALRNSQWALFYNPALLGLDTKSRIAYSFGIKIKETNLLSLAGMKPQDFDTFKDFMNNTSSSTSTAILKSAIKPENIDVSGTLGNILQNVDFGSIKGIKTTADIQNFMSDVLNNVGATPDQINSVSSATDLNTASQNFKNALTNPDGSLNNKGNEAFGDIKNSLVDAAKNTQGDTALIENVLSNITPDQFNGMVDIVSKVNSGSDLSLSSILNILGGVSISRGDNPGVDILIKDINLIQNTLKQNNLNISSQNGLVFQIGGKGVDGRGAIALGIFGNINASASATLDPTHNQIIIDAGNGNYAKVGISGNNINLDASNKIDYDNTSLLSKTANHQLHVNGIILGEVPLGYGQAFSTPIGDFSLGLTAKYIYAMGISINKTGSFADLSQGLKENLNLSSSPKTQTFGIDLGALYNYKGFSLGVVGKDLNSPSIKLNDNQQITLDPQFRAGLGYEYKILSLALDMDLSSNHTLSYISPKNQMIGGGMMFDFKYIDFRFGSMYDLKDQTNQGIILTGGINILGFLDIALQSNLKTEEIANLKIPSYFNLKVGGGFSW